MFELITRLLEDCVSPKEKKVHGTSPAMANSGYGMPSEGILASRPKNKLNTSMVKTGCKIPHAAPNAVCLYRTLISRQVRKYRSSRYSHNSRSLSETQP